MSTDNTAYAADSNTSPSDATTKSDETATDTTDILLDVSDLSVEYASDEGAVKAVRNVSFSIEAGETFGLVGESGSGKSTLALAVLQYLGENGTITGGRISFDGESLRELSTAELQDIRGNRIAHVPQSPDTSLNPSLEVGEQIAEVIELHQDVSESEAWERTIASLEEVNIPDPAYNAERYPHELSGGQKQRVLLAMALACSPELLILDEPTTGLDVTTEAKILDLVSDLKETYDTSIMLITHDLGVIAQVADTAAVMYAGEIMERGSVEQLFNNPANPYTQGLLEAIPQIGDEGDLDAIPGQTADIVDVPDGCIFADRCEYAEDACRSGPIAEESIPGAPGHHTRCRRWEIVIADEDENGNEYEDETTTEEPASTTSTVAEAGTPEERTRSEETILELDGLKKHFGEQSFFDRLFRGEPPVKAVDGVDLEVQEGETLGLVGESGCGKSTLAKTVLQLLDVTEGTIRFDGQPIEEMSDADLKNFRSEAQIVFQHPDSSLNPRKTVGSSIERPLKLFTEMDATERDQRVEQLLDQVELGAEYADRRPHELSGGEKQRVAIARAFAANPSFVVLDEPLSALDVSVQASILNLLSSLRQEYDSSYLFISHDLSVINHISDRIAVMYLGKIAEVGSREAVFEPPYHPYTEALLSSVPEPDPDVDRDRIHLEGDVPSARDTPSGCPFHTRCPKKIGDVCEEEVPELESVGLSDDETHQIACHLDEEEMADTAAELGVGHHAEGDIAEKELDSEDDSNGE